MKRSILAVCVTAVVIALVASPVVAALPDTNPLPNGKPYKMIWDLLQDLQDQINIIKDLIDKIQLIPGPQGDPGLACWDLDGNGNCDIDTEDKTGDDECTVADCQGPQGPRGATGPPGTCTDCTCPPGKFVTGFANGNLICSDLGLCNPGLGFCNGVCVDLNTDSNNCGSCGVTCPSQGACRNGQCGCGVGLTDCNGVCVNLQTDGNNCGACGTTCQSGTLCRCGVCSLIHIEHELCKSDGYCHSDDYCDPQSGECVWKLCSGAPCTAGNSCLSGFCDEDGYCV